MAMPPRRQRRWMEDEIDEALVERYQRALRSLLALSPDPVGNGPRVLPLSADAKEAFVDFVNEWGQHDAVGDEAAVRSKLEGYAARLALLHHVVSYVAFDALDINHPVGVESVNAGITLARWFASESLRVCSALRESAAERRQRELLDWLTSQGGAATVRDVMARFRSRYAAAEDARAAVVGLIDAGWAEWEPSESRPERGRPSERFRVRAHKNASVHNNPDDDGAEREPGSDG